MLKVYLLLSLAVTAWSAPQQRGSCLLLCGGNGVTCPDGYDCKTNGCGSECFQKVGYQNTQQKGCAPLACDLACPLGFIRDKHGCDTCKCDYHLIELGY